MAKTKTKTKTNANANANAKTKTKRHSSSKTKTRSSRKTRDAGNGNNSMIQNFIEKMFTLQLSLKMVHWATKNYAVHKATDKSMIAVMPLIDSFVETFLGKSSYSLSQYAVKHVPVKKITTSDELQAFISSNVAYLISLNTYIAKDEHSDLVGIRDDIVSELNILRYLIKLKK